MCIDAPDGKLRLVMELCVKSVFELLCEKKLEVCVCVLQPADAYCPCALYE